MAGFAMLQVWPETASAAKHPVLGRQAPLGAWPSRPCNHDLHLLQDHVQQPRGRGQPRLGADRRAALVPSLTGEQLRLHDVGHFGPRKPADATAWAMWLAAIPTRETEGW